MPSLNPSSRVTPKPTPANTPVEPAESTEPGEAAEPSRPRRVYLVCTAGHPNYGDELIAAQWLRYLTQHAPDAEVWMDCPAPGTAQLLLGDLHPGVRFVDTLYRLAWEAPSEEPWELAEFAARAVRNPGFAPRFAAGVELLQQVDTVHLLGGGYINDIWPRHLVLLAGVAALSRHFGVHAAMTGHGLVPEPTGARGLLERLARDFTVVDVRDPASRQALAEVEVSDSGDDAFLDTGSHLFDERESPEVMLCLQSDLLADGPARLADLAVSTLREWGIDGSQVGYIECIPGGDRRVFDLIDEFVPGIRFYPFAEIWREGLPAREGQRWLTTRFHPHLMAAAVDARGIVVSIREGYYDVAHESLLARGSGWSRANPGDVMQPPEGAAGFGNGLADLVAGKRAVAERVYGKHAVP